MNASDGAGQGGGVTSLLIDERARTVTVHARHRGLPDGAPPEWAAQGFDAWEESAGHTAVDALAVDGWSHEPVTSWRSAPLRDAPGRVAVALEGPGTSVTFHADAAVRRATRPLRTGAA
ncbi:hypothetical protein [Streptomyces avicenniae]|uniref:hypothetical protein n=1 Tax=Streptomyces avicenniae TaxID=500153 RepID=UPI00069CA5EA|nr:hypothetical protein [Streptomyces avicenniae]